MSENLHRLMETNHFIQNSAAGGTVTIAPAAAGLRSNIYAMILTAAGAVTVTVQDTSGAAISEPFAFGTNGGAVTLDVKVNGDPWFNTGIGLGLQFSISAAVQVSGDVYWLQTT
jgi:hypothetical protein